MDDCRRRHLLGQSILGRHVLASGAARFDWDEGKHPRGEGGRFAEAAAPPAAGPPPASAYDVRIDGDGLAKLRMAFGDGFDGGSLARLAGAQPGDTVKATVKGTLAQVVVHGKGYFSERAIPLQEGRRSIYNHTLEVEKAHRGQGLGTRVLATQVEEARRWGFGKLSTYAVGHRKGKDNGYYTWPLLGYDGEPSHDAREALGPVMGKAATVQEVLAMPGGREAWKEKGCSLECSFDLADGSRSLTILREYAKGKGIAVGFSASEAADVDLEDLEALWDRIAQEGWGWLGA